MTAKEIKPILLARLLYAMGYHAAFTEVQGADVFGVTRAKYCHEFEIKISKSDLMSELNCVKDLVLFGEPKRSYAKTSKHMANLGKTGKFYNQHMVPFLNDQRPNYFSFVVPSGLVGTAQEILRDTPYGVYEYNGGITKRKHAKLLHKDKLSDDMLFYLLRKASTEVEVLRSGTRYLTPQAV